MKIKECAKIMGCSDQFLRLCLQQGKVPFGLAVRTSSKWTYWIDEAKFARWMKDEKGCEIEYETD